MTDREKLYEMIVDAENEFHKKNHYAEDSKRIESVVEHLIANGVTVKEPQKPLTVVEATGTVDVVWFEQKHLGATYPCDAVIASDCVNVNMSMIGHRVPLVRPIKYYGKTWRCWAEKPTEAERQAAEWEK